MRISTLIVLFALSVAHLKAASEFQIFDLLETEKWDEAIIDLEQLIADEPLNPRLHYNLGVAFYRTNRYASAESAFKEALNLKIDDPVIQSKIYHNLGNTYFERGRAFYKTQPDLTLDLWSLARDQYKISLEIASESPNTEKNLQILIKLLDSISETNDSSTPESEVNRDNSAEEKGESPNEQEGSSESGQGDSESNEASDNPEASNRESSSQDPENQQASGSAPSTENDNVATSAISQEEALIFLESLQNQEKRLFPENIGWEQDESNQPNW